MTNLKGKKGNIKTGNTNHYTTPKSNVLIKLL